MRTKIEALRLAAELEACPTINYKTHAAELRRLHQEHEEDQKVIAVWRGRTQRAEAQRDALLEACRFYASMMGRRKSDGEPFYMTALDLDCGDRARAAIAKAEGEMK